MNQSADTVPSDTSENPTEPRPRPSLLRRGVRIWLLALGVVLVLIGAYALAGFYLVPHLIRSQATQWVKTSLGKELALGDIRFNPFRFTLDIGDLAIGAPSEPIVALGHLHLDFSARSLFQHAWRFDEVRIEKPFVQVTIDPDGALNLSELVPQSDEAVSDEPAPAIRIDNFTVADGRIGFADLSRPGHPEKTLTPIGFTLKDFQTDRSEGGAYTLNASSSQGETFGWTGTLSTAPIASRGRFSIGGLRADTVQKFLGEYLPVTVSAGQVALEGQYQFSYEKGVTRLTAAAPKLTLSGIAFAGKPDLFRGSVSIDHAQAEIDRIGYVDDGRAPMKLDGLMSALSMGGVTIAPVGAAAGSGAIRLDKLALGHSRFDYGMRKVELGALTLSGVDLPVRREANGAISLMKMMPVAPQGVSGAATETEKGPSWSVALASVALDRAAVRFEDRTVRPATRFTISPARLSVGDMSSDLSRPVTLDFEARINGKAGVKGEGTLVPATAKADIGFALSSLPLEMLLPYIPAYPGLEIKSGVVGASGKLHAEGADMAALRFGGNATIDNFVMNEVTTHSPIVAWRAFALTGIDYRASGVTVDHGRLSAPLGRVEILPDGRFNYASMMGEAPSGASISSPAKTGNDKVAPAPVPDQASTSAPATAATPAPVQSDDAGASQPKIAVAAASAPAPRAASAQEAPSLPFSLKRLDISGGTMSFADYSIDPNFEARIDALQGSVGMISNRPGTVSSIDLSGHVIDRFSPATIKGTMDLFGYDRRTDMKVVFRNIELPVFNPYSGRYAGYAIAKGKLSTEFAYWIEDRALKADHHVVIDQLKWGQATESKQKVPLPIRLATSLLKDKDGVIDLEVPVTGSLDDPQFRLGPIIWKIVGNVITKAITAPFRLIGSIFGGAEKAQFVDFAPGSADLPEGATEAFAALAKALEDREALELDIPAGPGIREDAVAIADGRIDTLLMAKEAKKGEPTDVAALKPDALHDRLKDLYREKLGRKPDFAPLEADPALFADAAATAGDGKEGGKVKESDVRKAREAAYMRDGLRSAFLPSAAELEKLGTARAIAVRDALLADGKLAPERLFMVTGMTVSERDGHSRLELKLK